MTSAIVLAAHSSVITGTQQRKYIHPRKYIYTYILENVLEGYGSVFGYHNKQENNNSKH